MRYKTLQMCGYILPLLQAYWDWQNHNSIKSIVSNCINIGAHMHTLKHTFPPTRELIDICPHATRKSRIFLHPNTNNNNKNTNHQSTSHSSSQYSHQRPAQHDRTYCGSRPYCRWISTPNVGCVPDGGAPARGYAWYSGGDGFLQPKCSSSKTIVSSVNKNTDNYRYTRVRDDRETFSFFYVYQWNGMGGR